MNKKAEINGIILTIGIVILLLGAVAVGVGVNNNIQRLRGKEPGFLPFLSIGGRCDFIAPIWGRVECEVVDNIDFTKYTPETGGSVFCNYFTRNCKVSVFTPPEGEWREIKVFRCEKDTNVCQEEYVGGVTHNSEISIGSITPNERIYLEGYKPCGFGGLQSCPMKVKYRVQYDLYGLNYFEEGAKKQAKGTCTISQNQKARICVEGDDFHCQACPNELSMQTVGEGISWCNFVTKWACTYGLPNIHNHPQQGEVYCSGNRIWKIAKLTFQDGTTRRVDPVNTLGEFIGTVDCCPQMAGCNANFEYDQQPGECWSDAQCRSGGAWLPVGSKKIQRNYCDVGLEKCVDSEIKTVECAVDADCLAGQYCDITDWKCKGSPPPNYCGDGICDPILESSENCPIDCGETPAEAQCIADGGIWIDKSKTVIAPWWKPWQKDITTDESFCRYPHKSFLGLGLLIFGGIALIFSFFQLAKGEESGKFILIIALILLAIGAILWILAGKGII